MAEPISTMAAATLSCALLFQVTDGGDRRIYRTDGSLSGTVLVKDLPDVYGLNSYYFQSTKNGVVFSYATDPYGRELGVTSGAVGDLRLVRDINPGHAYSSDPGGTWNLSFDPPGGVAYSGQFQKLGDKVIFAATNPALGREIWISDGTRTGTRVVKDHLPGVDSGIGSKNGPTEFIYSNGKFAIYTVLDKIHGSSLFATNGTAAGSVFLVGWNASRGLERAPSRFGLLGSNRILFSRNERKELWVTDGTTAGTRLLKTFAGTRPVDTISRLPGKSYALFSAWESGVGYELWITNGTPAGTKRVKDINLRENGSSPDGFVEVGADVYFAATADASGRELWKTRGTSATTRLVADVVPGSTGSDPLWLTAYKGRVVFRAKVIENGSYRYRPYSSTGTAIGTKKLSEFTEVWGPFVNLGETFVFPGNESTVYATNLYSSKGLVNSQQRLTTFSNAKFIGNRVEIATGGTGAACPN